MNRITLLGAVMLSAAAFTAPAKAERVLRGAFDICQSVDHGRTKDDRDMEACCAQETTEYDDGTTTKGVRYCVVCEKGTENCNRTEASKNTSPMDALKNATSKIPSQPKSN